MGSETNSAPSTPATINQVATPAPAPCAARSTTRQPIPGLNTGTRDFAMLVGFALFQTWVTLCFFTPQLFPNSTGNNHVYEISLVVSTIVLTVGALNHRRLAPALRTKRMRWGLALCGAVGTALVPFCFGTSSAFDIVLTLTASILTGLATGLFNVAWCSAFVHRGNAIDFTVSVVASSVIIYVLTNLAYSPAVSPYVMLAFSIAMPLACAWLLCMGRDDAPQADQRMVVPIDTGSRKRFLVQLCVGIFVVSLVDEFLRNYYLGGTDLSFYSSQINLLTLVFKVLASAMVVTALHRMRYEDFSFLYRASFMLALIAALLLPFADSTGTVGYALTNCGAFLFKVTVLLVTLEFCAQGAPATFTFCVVRAVWSFDLLLGTILYGANDALDPGMDPGMLTIVFVVLVAVAYLFVFSPDRDGGFVNPGGEVSEPGSLALASNGGALDEGGAPAAPASAPTEPTVDYDTLCDQHVAQGGLSPREGDVLRLLVRGRTTTRIQDELHISANTVNTHVKHVVQKLDVHSRQVLLDLVERTAARM